MINYLTFAMNFIVFDSEHEFSACVAHYRKHLLTPDVTDHELIVNSL